MERRAVIEWSAVAVLVGLFLLALYPALLHARAERRDGIRRQEVRQFKHLMEKQNNELGHYPLDLEASPHQFVVTEQEGERAISWYLRAELEREAEPTAGFDLEYNMYYRIEQEDGKTFYDICGGTNHCGVD